MVLTVSRDPALRFNALMQQRNPVARRFQTYFDRIERTQVGVFNALASAPSRTRRVLEPVQAEVDSLTEMAYDLSQRMTSLENRRVVSQSAADLATDLAGLERYIEETEDPTLRQDYIASRRALQERLSKLEDVERQLDHVEAQLLGLANEIEGVLTEVVRLQASGADVAGTQVSGLVARLQRQSVQLLTPAPLTPVEQHSG